MAEHSDTSVAARPGEREKWISLAPDLTPLPENLLSAHASGRVLFITGSGVSVPAGLPDFRKLVVDVYREVEKTTVEILDQIGPATSSADVERLIAGLRPDQAAEVLRFAGGDYDVVLGMLERRIDRDSHRESTVRRAVSVELRKATAPADIHRSIFRLSNRGGATALITTNFDRLFQLAAASMGQTVESYALGAIPRPSSRPEFAGIFHIHGMLDPEPTRLSDIIITDRDFGEFYLRRRIVPDLIYDAARLFHLVLVGYSANDAPMRYLLNAVAADGSRFTDLKERFSFVSMKRPFDRVKLEDWRGRGITPIPYDDANDHAALHDILRKWADFSPFGGDVKAIDNTLVDLSGTQRDLATEQVKNLFDYLVDRGSPSERRRYAKLITDAGADYDWLKAINLINRTERERR